MNKPRNSKPTTVTVHPLLIIGMLTTIAGLIAIAAIVLRNPANRTEEPTPENKSTTQEDSASELDGFVFQYDEEPNHMSSLIYNCEGGVLCLVLDAERIENIQKTLCRHPKAKQIYIGPDHISVKSQNPDLEFQPGREWLESAIQDVINGDYASITLVKSVPADAVDDQAEVPADAHRVQLYLTKTTTDFLIANIEANYADSGLDYCVIWQSMDFGHPHVDTYRVYYDQLQAARKLLSKKGTKGVTLYTDILPPDAQDF